MKQAERDAIFYKYKGIVDKIVNDMCSNRNELGDLQQEGYAALLECIDNFNGNESSYTSYIYTSVRGKLLHYFRSERKYYRNKQIGKLYHLLNNNTDFIDEVERDDFFKQIEQVLTKMQYKCVIMFYRDRYRYSEIADITKTSESNIKNHLDNARKRLKTHFSEKKR